MRDERELWTAHYQQEVLDACFYHAKEYSICVEDSEEAWAKGHESVFLTLWSGLTGHFERCLSKKSAIKEFPDENAREI